LASGRLSSGLEEGLSEAPDGAVRGLAGETRGAGDPALSGVLPLGFRS